MRNKAIFCPLIISLFLMINSSFAVAETLSCYIKSPGGEHLNVDTETWPDGDGTYDRNCASSCLPSSASCCQEEGWYTWHVDSSHSGSKSGDAYFVNWDGDQLWCTCHGGTWVSGAGTSGQGAAGPGCCGDDGSSDDWCASGYASCLDGTYYTDGDSNTHTCECGNLGTQANCNVEGESGCWSGGGGQNECCGDDGNSDDYCLGGYTGCLDGTYYLNGDTNSHTCSCGSGTWTGTGGENNCCGDDSSEDYCAGGYTSCYDAAYYTDGDSNQYTCECGSGYWLIGGEPNPGPCCGDDTEYRTTCLDSGEGLCAISTDDEACCQAGDKCVYNDACYNNGVNNDVYNEYNCQAGTWHDNVQPSASIQINGGDTYTTVEGVTLSLTFSDMGSGIDQCAWMNDGGSWTEWQDCGASPQDKAWTLRDEDGTRTVHFKVRDKAVPPNEREVSDAIVLDRAYPNSWVDALPEWTNGTGGMGAFFDVAWDGNDATSGVASYDIQYRIIDRGTGSVAQDWANWITRSEAQPKSETFGPLNPVTVSNYNNHTFEFRIRATDNAGWTSDYNSEPFSNTNIDVVAPVCDVEDPGEYQTESTFTITIDGLDGESGMSVFEGRIRGPDGTGGWKDIVDNCINLTPMDDADSADIECTLNEGEWEFGCRGTDVSGNMGDWSATMNTTVDISLPDVQITEPDFIWTNLEEFTLVWVGGDSGPSGLDHYDAYYYVTAWPGGPPSDSQWQHWLGPTTDTNTNFGMGAPTVLAEGQTYHINITATDRAGNQKSAVVNVTIDRTDPVIDITVLDQYREPIPSEWIPSGTDIDLINITSGVYDELSGIENNTIEYMVYGEVPDHKLLECGTGPSPGTSVCSTADSSQGRHDIDYDDRTSVRYRVIARDRAGNENRTRYYFSVSHPLANFGSASCYIALGDSKLVPVMVRNVQNQADNVTINLTGYPFAEFKYECDPSECVISDETRGMVALNVNPYEERTYYVRVLSSEPGEDTLDLAASSSLEPGLNDTHTISIRSSYPVYFPGIGPWAIVLLLVMAGFAYGALSRDKS